MPPKRYPPVSAVSCPLPVSLPAAAIALFAAAPGEVSGQAPGPRLLPHAEFVAALEAAGDEALLIDCRTAEEIAAGGMPGALHYDYLDREFAYRVDSLPRERPVFVYCASGGRSAGAAELLDAIGFGEVYDLEGGLRAAEPAGAGEGG